MLNVRESPSEVAALLNQAVSDNKPLIPFRSAAFVSSVTDEVFINPSHVTQVMEVPTGLPAAPPSESPST
ncbi:MAG TPA: hypothetical protein VGY97_06450 [Solirubrobacteraceae bacterium]|jgi:hypothetical protein|nr:hypothetical protein [Solirubrobacteraceae bacterium]